MLGSLLVVAVLVALAAASGSYEADAAPEQRSRVLDRTLLCALEPTSGIHELKVYGQSGVRLEENPAKWKELPTAFLNSGGRANQWEERFECPSSRQVVIRIRAEFARPTDWDYIAATRQFGATGPPLRLAQLAAATPRGTALAYVDVHESGRTRIFLRGNCVRGRI